MFKRQKTYYKAYKGRSSSKGKKLALAALFILIVLLAGVVYFVVPEFIVFTSDGFYFTFSDRNHDEPPVADNQQDEEDEEFNIVIDGRPQDSDDDDNEGTAVFPRMLGVRDDISSLLQSGYSERLADAAERAGCNTLCFEIKGEDGILRIPVVTSYSSQGMEREDAAAVKESIGTLKQSRPDMKLAAIVTGLQDERAPRAYPENAVRTANATWLDRENHRWISPYRAMASEYLCEIISSCAAAGFDAVIFDKICFPTAGRLDMINWQDGDSAEMRYAAIEGIVADLVETANREKVALCMIIEGQAQEDSASGQRITAISAYCHTIFLTGRPNAAVQAEIESYISEGCDVGWVTDTPFAVPTDEKTALIATYLS